MDAQQMRQLKPKLLRFLDQFDDCFPRKDTRAHLPVYVSGQLSDIPEKSVEPIALNAGVPPRTLQEFLSQHHWDHDRMRDRLQQIVRDEHPGPHSIGIIDETSDVKKGDKTPGVQRQWCGTVGKNENCIVTVHLGYARDDFHCLLDGELYLPESSVRDRDRCREAGIPDDMVYRPKWKIALELYDRALGNGLHFDWLTFDEGYGSKPEFLRELSARDQRFVGEVPRNFMGWIKPPRVVTRAFRKHGRGRGRKMPRLASGSPRARRVDEMLKQGDCGTSPGSVAGQGRAQGADGLGGQAPAVLPRGRERPAGRAAAPDRRPRRPEPDGAEVLREQRTAGDVDPDDAAGRVLALACGTLFRGPEVEIGLDQYEGRRYQGLKRHLILSCVSYLFLSRMRQEFGGEKSGADGVPGAHGDGGLDPVLVAGQATVSGSGGKNAGEDLVGAAEKRRGKQVPHQAHTTATPRVRHQTHYPPAVHMGFNLAVVLGTPMPKGGATDQPSRERRTKA